MRKWGFRVDYDTNRINLSHGARMVNGWSEVGQEVDEGWKHSVGVEGRDGT